MSPSLLWRRGVPHAKHGEMSFPVIQKASTRLKTGLIFAQVNFFIKHSPAKIKQ
jgi:hypothetical protein